MSNQDYEELHSFLRQLVIVQEKLTTDLAVVNATHKKLAEQTVTSDYMCRKLKALYKNIIEASNAESDLLSAISIATQKIVNNKTLKSGGVQDYQRPSAIINNLDSTLPVWPNRQALPLCGSVPPPFDWTITSGHQVAACVSKKTDPEERWILGTVVKYNDKTQHYIIEDIMEESHIDAQSARERHNLPKTKVLALPQWSCTPGIEGTFYKTGQKILALYPQTTCFYPAIVHRPPTQQSPNNYLMHFFDDDYEDGRTRYQEVAIRFVVDATPRTPPAPKPVVPKS